MNELTGYHRADAAIIGGGLTALLLGSALGNAGMKVILLQTENGPPPPETAIGTVLCASVYRRIETVWGTDQASLYATALQAQLQSIHAAPPAYMRDTAVYTYARTAGELPALEAQHNLFRRMHLPVREAPDAGGCPFPAERSLLMPGQIQADLPQWMDALNRAISRHGGQVCQSSLTIALESSRIRTPRGCVEAPFIIHASDIPLGLRSFRLLACLESRRGAHCHLSGGYPLHSCQIPVKDGGLVLLPAAGGITASLTAGRCGTRQMQAQLAQFGQLLSQQLPDWRQETLHYTRRVCSIDGLPLIGVLPGSRHLCAAACGEHGVLGAMHAAQVLTRRILGQALPEDQLYAPDRKLPKRLVRRQQRRMISLYAANALRRSAPACAHCGCRMRYSTFAERWECPFCGSAYTMLGQVVAPPGMQPARISVRQRPDI